MACMEREDITGLNEDIKQKTEEDQGDSPEGNPLASVGVTAVYFDRRGMEEGKASRISDEGMRTVEGEWEEEVVGREGRGERGRQGVNGS